MSDFDNIDSAIEHFNIIIDYASKQFISMGNTKHYNLQSFKISDFNNIDSAVKHFNSISTVQTNKNNWTINV